MATVNLYLDMRGKAADGKGSVVIIIYHNQTTATVKTGIRINPKNWKNQTVVNLPNASKLNQDLRTKVSDIEKKMMLLSYDNSYQSMTATQIKHAYISDIEAVVRTPKLADLFAEYIANGGLKDGTKEIYTITLDKIRRFSGSDTVLRQVNLKWLREFDGFLSRTQGINGRAIYMRSLRAVCNYARHKGIKYDYPFDAFKIKQAETSKRSIPIETLREFYSYPTSESNSRYRDYFFLMFYLIGINIKDLLLAKKKQVLDGRLEYIREKTGKKYSIKIEPEAQELLDRYAGKSDNLVEVMDHYVHYDCFTHDLNDALKTIGPVVTEEVTENLTLFDTPKTETHVKSIIPKISSYYARHTWATLAYEIGIPMDVISQALGHSFGNRTTLIYVKPDRSKVDEANRKVIDYFKSGL